jgi:hypothetical protein
MILILPIPIQSNCFPFQLHSNYTYFIFSPSPFHWICKLIPHKLGHLPALGTLLKPLLWLFLVDLCGYQRLLLLELISHYTMHVLLPLLAQWWKQMTNGAYIMSMGLHATLSMSNIEFHE